MSVILKSLLDLTDKVARDIGAGRCYCRHPYLKCGVCTDREYARERELAQELKSILKDREQKNEEFNSFMRSSRRSR